MSVTEGCDPTRVVAAGPGLQKALSEKPNNFNIITRFHLPTCPTFISLRH